MIIVDMVGREGLGKSMVDMERNRINSSQPPHQLPPQIYRSAPGPTSQPPDLPRYVRFIIQRTMYII